MKHTMIDTSQMELTDKVVAIKRVTKVVKGGLTETAMSAAALERLLKFPKRSARAEKTQARTS